MLANFFLRINPKKQVEKRKQKADEVQEHYKKFVGDIKKNMNITITTKANEDRMADAINEAIGKYPELKKDIENMVQELKDEVKDISEPTIYPNELAPGLHNGLIHRTAPTNTEKLNDIKINDVSLLSQDEQDAHKKQKAIYLVEKMVKKGLCSNNSVARESQVDELMKMDSNAVEALEKAVSEIVRVERPGLDLSNLDDESLKGPKTKHSKTKHSNPKLRSKKTTKSKANKKASK